MDYAGGNCCTFFVPLVIKNSCKYQLNYRVEEAMNNNKYDKPISLYAENYDLEHPVTPQDALDFYFQYAKKANGPILEPMCGTGRFLIPMMEAGFNIEGLDASQSMLRILHRKCVAKGLKPNVWEGYLQDLNLNYKYQFIFIPYGSFGIIADPKEAKICLTKIWEHLEDGGVFVFEADTLNLHSSASVGIWEGGVQKKPNGEIIIASSLVLPLSNQVETMIRRYDLVNKNRIVYTEVENFQLRFYNHNQMYNLLKSVGYSSIEMFKAFDYSQPVDASDSVIIYECRK